jgi:RPA family protein
MKLKYMIPSLMSAIFMLVGCSEKFEPSYLGGLRVSSSFVAISPDGSSTDFVVNAADSWEIKDVPEWLTVTPLSGGAGETKVVVSAPAATGIKSAVLKLVSGSLVQEIFISQGKKASVEIATCKQVLEGSDGKTYQVKGTVTNIANTTYGNWYLNDGTGQIYIYGTLDANGATKNFTSLGLEVGDEVTVEGPKTTYNGTVELVDVTVIKIEKSIVKIVEASASEISKDGGELTVKLAFKGNLMPTLPDDCNWVRYKTMTLTKGTVTAVMPNPADTAYVKFVVDPNEGAGRSTTIGFSCSDASNFSSISYTIKQAANVLPHGMNPDDPYTVAEAIQKCQEIGATTDGEIYYAKGKISSIKEISTSYGNGTFNISDDGTDNNALTCYRSFGLDNQKFTAEDEIAVGDEVVVCGKLVNYTKDNNVTPEFSGNVYIYSLKKGSGPSPTEGADGSKIVTVAEFIAAPESNEVYYQLTGTVKNLKDNDLYGNFDLEDATGSVYVYGVLSEKGGAKKLFQELAKAKNIKNGSKITIVGTRGSYNGKIEVMNAYFISVSN